MLEKAMISGVTHTVEEAVYEVRDIAPADLFEALSAASVNVDTVIQIGTDIVFSSPIEDKHDVEDALTKLGANWTEQTDLGKVSVVGAGMRSNPGVAASAFATLRSLDVEPRYVSTSPIKIAFFVPRDDVERSVQALHETFELSDPEAERAHA